jgi:hypothetical protein
MGRRENEKEIKKEGEEGRWAAGKIRARTRWLGRRGRKKEMRNRAGLERRERKRV